MEEEYQARARGTVDTLCRMLQDLSRHYLSRHYLPPVVIGNVDIELQIDWTAWNNLLWSELAAKQSVG
jgi:hypothetical protein